MPESDGSALRRLSDRSDWDCAWAHGVVGETERGSASLERLQHAPAGVWLDPALMGQVYAAVGDIDRAIEWYQKGIDERSHQDDLHEGRSVLGQRPRRSALSSAVASDELSSFSIDWDSWCSAY